MLASAFADGDFSGLQALGAQAANFLVPAAWAGAPAAAAAPGALATLFAGCAALVLYAAVWVLAQAGNVLILLSPSSLLDSLLVVAKTTVAVVLLGLADTLPGQLLALVLVVLAVWLLPRAVRLVVFGTLVSRDLVCHRLLRRPTPVPAADRPLRCFTSCRLGSLPPLTCGRLDVQDEALAFSWRPLLMGRQRTLSTAIDPAACTLGRGFLSPVVCWRESGTTRCSCSACCRPQPPTSSWWPGDLSAGPPGKPRSGPGWWRAGAGAGRCSRRRRWSGWRRRRRAEPQPSRATGRRRSTESAANRAVPAQTRVAPAQSSRAAGQSKRHSRSNSSQATA